MNMKKPCMVLLALVMLLSLAACGGGGELDRAAKEIESITGEKTTADDVKEAMEQMEALTGEKVTAQDVVDFTRDAYELMGGLTGSSGGGLSDKDLEDADKAWDALREMTYAEDWRWDSDGDGYINGKWDDKVMYAPVPAPPEGIGVYEMQFNSKAGQKYREYGQIGDMYIDGTDYEYIWVNFNCSQAQLDELIQGFTDGGWLTAFEEDYGNGDMWHFYHRDGYYAYLRAGSYFADEGYELGANLDVTPAYYELPKTIAGVPAPDFGFLLSDLWLEGYDEDWEEIEHYPVDTPVGGLPPYWALQTDNWGGVTDADMQAYRDLLVADGWEVTYDEKSEGEYGQYTVDLRKGELIVHMWKSNRSATLNYAVANNDDMFY